MGDGFNLKESRFEPDIRKKEEGSRKKEEVPHCEGLVRNQNRLPRVIVGIPSLEVYQARLDGALSKLVCRKVPCLY